MDAKIDSKVVSKHMEHQEDLEALIKRFKRSSAMGIKFESPLRVELQGVHYLISGLNEGQPVVEFDNERNNSHQAGASVPPQSINAPPIAENRIVSPPPIAHTASYGRFNSVQMPQIQPLPSQVMLQNAPVPLQPQLGQFFSNNFSQAAYSSVSAIPRQISSVPDFSSRAMGLPIIFPSRENSFSHHFPALPPQVDRAVPRPSTTTPTTPANHSQPPVPLSQMSFTSIFKMFGTKDCFLEEDFQSDLDMIQVREDNAPENTAPVVEPILKSEPMETADISEEAASSILQACLSLSQADQRLTELSQTNSLVSTAERSLRSSPETPISMDEVMEDTLPPVKAEPTPSRIASIPDESLKSVSVKKEPSASKPVTKLAQVAQASQEPTPDPSPIHEPTVLVPIAAQPEQVSSPVCAPVSPSQTTPEESDKTEAATSQTASKKGDIDEMATSQAATADDSETAENVQREFNINQEAVARFKAKLQAVFAKPVSPVVDIFSSGTASTDSQAVNKVYPVKKPAIPAVQTVPPVPGQLSTSAKIETIYSAYASTPDLSPGSSPIPLSPQIGQKSSLKRKSCSSKHSTKKVRFDDNIAVHVIPARDENPIRQEVESNLSRSSVCASLENLQMSFHQGKNLANPASTDASTLSRQKKKKKKHAKFAESSTRQASLNTTRTETSSTPVLNPSHSIKPNHSAPKISRPLAHVYNQDSASSCGSGISGTSGNKRVKNSIKYTSQPQLSFRCRWDQREPISKTSSSSSSSQRSTSAGVSKPQISSSFSKALSSTPCRSANFSDSCQSKLSSFNSGRLNNMNVGPVWANSAGSSSRPPPKIATPINSKPNPKFLNQNPVSGHSKAPFSLVTKKDPPQLGKVQEVCASKSRPQKSETSFFSSKVLEVDSSPSPMVVQGNFFSFNEQQESSRTKEPSDDFAASEVETTDLYAGLKSYLDGVKKNQQNGVSYFTALPNVCGITLDEAFNKHWDFYYDLSDASIPDDEIFQVYLDYFVSLAYLGFNIKGNLDYYNKRMKEDFYIYREGGKKNPMPYALPERYISWMKCAWLILRFVGPSFYLNSEDSLSLRQFVAIAESSADLKNFLQENGYADSYAYMDWNFNKFKSI